MSRRLSFPGRRHFDASADAAVALVLIEISHPSLDAPLRFSTDMTERLSDDPLSYGTRSAWRGADPATQPFSFAAVDVEWPGERADTGPEARLFVSAIGTDVIDALRSVTEPPVVHMAKVLSTQPDVIEEECLDLEMHDVSADAVTLECALSHLPIWVELFPADRMSPDRFPALFR